MFKLCVLLADFMGKGYTMINVVIHPATRAILAGHIHSSLAFSYLGITYMDMSQILS
jgi:hypothetical protein